MKIAIVDDDLIFAQSFKKIENLIKIGDCNEKILMYKY